MNFQIWPTKDLVVTGKGRCSRVSGVLAAEESAQEVVGGQRGHPSDRARGHLLEKEVNWQQARDGLHCSTRRGAERTCDPKRSFALHLAEGLDVALAAGPVEVP